MAATKVRGQSTESSSARIMTQVKIVCASSTSISIGFGHVGQVEMDALRILVNYSYGITIDYKYIKSKVLKIKIFLRYRCVCIIGYNLAQPNVSRIFRKHDVKIQNASKTIINIDPNRNRSKLLLN